MVSTSVPYPVLVISKISLLSSNTEPKHLAEVYAIYPAYAFRCNLGTELP